MNMENNMDIWSSIASVLGGNYTKEELQQVDIWITEDEKNEKFFNQLRNTSFSTDIEEKALIGKELIYIKTREKITRVRLNRKIRIWQCLAAASIALLCLISRFIFISPELPNPVYVESRSPIGSTTQLTLSDGTIVELNAGSTLNYPLFFQGDKRVVSLVGEAYFEVAKDMEHPFIVESGNMKIQVLGTQFNIKSYEDECKLVTTLSEGSVRVQFDEYKIPIILKPNQQLIFDKLTQEVDIAAVNAELYSSWKNGECFFENEKLADIVKILERQFGVQINIVSESLKNQFFSGFFTKQQGLYHILNSFKKKRNLEYRRKESGVEIYEGVNK